MMVGRGCCGSDDSRGWFCKFNQGWRTLFIIAEGKGGKICDVRGKYVDIARMYFEIPATTCQGSRRFAGLSCVIRDQSRAVFQRPER